MNLLMRNVKNIFLVKVATIGILTVVGSNSISDRKVKTFWKTDPFCLIRKRRFVNGP